MPLAPNPYPLDLTGTAGTNLITNEVHTFAQATDRIFVPAAGPFYTVGMEIRHGVTNVLLQPNSQFKLLHLHKAGSIISGKEVCVVVYITDSSIPSVSLQYQVIGGVYSETAETIRVLLETMALPDATTVSWGQLLDTPDQFTPSEHLHHVDNLYGMSDVVAVLERMRIAILAGDSPAIDAIYQYIHALLVNLDYATTTEVIDLIGPGSFSDIKTYPTYASLKAETGFTNNSSTIYVTTGRNVLNDGQGRIFMWDVTSTITPDDDRVVLPDLITLPNPGRLISVLNTENNLQSLALTLGRKILSNGAISADIGDLNFIGAASLDTIIDPNLYLFASNTTGRPFNVDSGILQVERVSENVITQLIYTLGNTALVDDGVVAASNLTLIYRMGYRAINIDPIVWSDFEELTTANRVGRHGIDSPISKLTLASISLDAVHAPGKYLINGTTLDSPVSAGIVEVEMLTGTFAAPLSIIQTIRTGIKTISRFGSFSTVWTFTDWVDVVTFDTIPAVMPDCNLGIAVYHSGADNFVVPAYIGENSLDAVDNFDIVTVFISGRYIDIPIATITPLSYADIGSQIGSALVGYIYLVETTPNTFILKSSLRAPWTTKDTRGPTLKRDYLMETPVSGTPSNTTLLLGIFRRKGNIGSEYVTHVRSWFRDVGAQEWPLYGANAYSGILDAPLSGGVTETGAVISLDLKDSIVITTDFNTFFASPLYNRSMDRLHALVWAGEEIEVSLSLEYAIDQPTSAVNSLEIKLLPYIQPANGTADDTYPERLITMMKYPGTSNDVSNNWWQHCEVNMTLVAKKTGLFDFNMFGALRTDGAGIKGVIRGYNGSPIKKSTITAKLNEIHRFSNLLINKATAGSGVATIQFAGINLDTNLYDAYVLSRGTAPVANEVVNFIVTSTAFLSASTTTGHALTVDNRWPAGVSLYLINNGTIAGRGGDGGRGGRAFYIRGGNPYDSYIGGSLSLPSSHVHGKNGGDAIYATHAISVTNNGTISGGTGGGGGSGGAISRYSTSQGFEPVRCQSGSGGGGGWPLGSGGLAGQVILDESTNQDYYVSDTYYGALHYTGNPGASATTAMVPTSGGAARSNPNLYGGYANTPQGGTGGVLATAIATAGADGGTYYGETGYSFGGDGGYPGASGKAVVGNSLITWISTGSRYGAIT